jgi:hypothetical protein
MISFSALCKDPAERKMKGTPFDLGGPEVLVITGLHLAESLACHSRNLWRSQRATWSGDRFASRGVTPCLAEIERILTEPSPLLQPAQKKSFIEIKGRIIAGHHAAAKAIVKFAIDLLPALCGACRRPSAVLKDRFARDPVLSGLPNAQWHDWNCLHNFLTEILEVDPKLKAGFARTDKLAALIDKAAVTRAKKPRTLTDFNRACSWLQMLPADERLYQRDCYQTYFQNETDLARVFPHLYGDPCVLFNKKVETSVVRPHFDGFFLYYGNLKDPIRVQSNSCMAELLALFESQNWPRTVDCSKIKGTLKQAIEHFRRTKSVIRLSIRRKLVRWDPPLPT